jgi:transposase
MTHGASTEPICIGVGIDTARYGHHATFLRPDLQPAADALAVSETADGYQRLQRRLERLHQKHPQGRLLVRLDAAGPYAINLEVFLRGLPLPMALSVGHPLENRRYREVHFPKRKADPVDSYCLARYALKEDPRTTPECPAPFRALREIAGRLESQTRQSTRLVNQLHNLMARVFPELALIAGDFSANWVLGLLAAYPTATRIARARPASLERIAYLSARKAQALQRHARRTVASFDGPEAEGLVTELAAQVKRSRQAETRLLGSLVETHQQLPDVGPIQTIPGIGAATAAVLAAKIVSIDRFRGPDQLVSYFGVFPEEEGSGVDKDGNPKPGRQFRMSRRGNDLVRKYLWNAARSAVLCNPAAKALYQRLVAKGRPRSAALGHVMRKLLHLVFAIWKTGKPFDPQHYPWLPNDASASTEATGHTEDSPPKRSVVTAASTVSLSPTAPSVNATPAAQAGRRGINFAAIRSQVSMRDVLDRLGHLDRLTGAGPQRRGPCPVHAPGTRRRRPFSVNLDKHLFRCFDVTCGAQGNVLDLWAAVHGLPLTEAASDLAAAFGLSTGTEKNPSSPSALAEPVGGPATMA